MKPLNQDAINFLSTSIDQGRPIPGQSLTNSKDSPNNWERPPEFTNIDDGIHKTVSWYLNNKEFLNDIVYI